MLKRGYEGTECKPRLIDDYKIIEASRSWQTFVNGAWKIPNFGETTGKGIANRNLWISIPSLLCGFAVWIYWSIITVQMLNAGFPFKPAELFTLAAIAGLTGATLRIPSSFFIRIAGGRNTIVFTTALLMIPALGTGIALQSKETPLWVFQLLAFLSGFGGGNFASSMSNIFGSPSGCRAWRWA